VPTRSREQAAASKRALVTGASGFVGRNLCQLLVRRGWEVVAAARRVPEVAMTKVSARILPLSENANDWQEALASIDCVVHLAATVHQMKRASAGVDYRAVNLEGTKFVAAQAAKAGVRRFIYLSSIKVNGEGGTRIYSSDDAPMPVDDYGRSKMESEWALRDISAQTGLELVIIRPPLVYGPGVRANFKRLLRLAGLGVPLPFASIRNRRSLVGVENLIDFVASCMEHPRAAGQTWLVSDGEDMSTPELVEKLMHLMGKKPRFFPVPTRWLKGLARIVGQESTVARLCDSLQMDITPARVILGWNPPNSVDYGLASTVAAYLDTWRR
jgi:nucleoside-diphosphate-sugar epimerase